MSKNKSKSGIAVIVILVLALLGIAAYVGYTYVQKDISGNRNTKTEYNLVIEKDDFAYQIGEKLKSNGIIKNDTV
jgi:cell division protein YceG involved in septum cleavage